MKMKEEKKWLMKQRSFSEKVTILSVLMIGVILCGAIIFAASGGKGRDIQDRDAKCEDVWGRKAEELRNSLCDWKGIDEAIIQIMRDADEEITMVWAAVIMSEEVFDSEKEKLTEHVMNCFEGLDDNIIDITYIDSSSYEILNPDETTAF